MEQRTITYLGKATLHFGHRCRDVYGQCVVKDVNDERIQREAARQALYDLFKKENVYLKLEEVQVVRAPNEGEQ